MAWTREDVDTLKAAIAAGRGARSIQIRDQVLTFNSISDMLALLAVMEAEVAASAGDTSRTRYAAFRKGC